MSISVVHVKTNLNVNKIKVADIYVILKYNEYLIIRPISRETN